MAQSKTKKTTKKDQPEIGKFLDMMLENQERMNKALIGMRKRSGKISEMMSEQIYQGQRDALELTKVLASNPRAFSDNAKSLMDATAKAQNQAVDFAKELYKEQVDAGETFRKSMQAIAKSSREMAEAAAEAGRQLTQKNPVADMWKDNPMADMWKKGLDGLRN